MPYEKSVDCEWLIREALPEELNFIYATWLNSYQKDSIIGQSLKKTTFFLNYPEIIDEILNGPLTKVLVAYFAETPTLILAYLVFEPHLLHYVFTKELYRKSGIARSLFLKAFDGKPVEFSHLTFHAEPIVYGYQHRLSFNPFKLYKRFKKGDS